MTTAMGAFNAAPTFQLVFLFHANLDLLRRTLPLCLEALTRGSEEDFEVTLHADGSPNDVAEQLPGLCAELGLDELRIRRRVNHVASGDPSNNGHRRLLDTRSPYVIVIEDDVAVFRTDPSFDPLRATRLMFERHTDVPVIFTISDHWQWSWTLQDTGPALEQGVRSVNRVSTHMIGYAVERFVPPARRFGAFEPDVFIDRDDLSYNWEDVVSHVATTGGRQIAFPECWPLKVFHCDRKIADGSIHHTRDPQLKQSILDELVSQFAPGAAASCTGEGS
jgi:hypothetical protein